MTSYHNIRKYLKKTGVELITYEQCREIRECSLQENKDLLQKWKSKLAEASPVTRGETQSFQLIKIMKKKQPERMTISTVKKLVSNKAKALEHVRACYEKFANRRIVPGKGIEIIKDENEEKDEHTVMFERIKELLKSRNSLDTWSLNKGMKDEKKKEILIKGQWKNSVFEVVEAKKREMKEQTRKEVQKILSSRQYQPSSRNHYSAFSLYSVYQLITVINVYI